MLRKIDVSERKVCCNCEGPATQDHGHNCHSCGDRECEVVADSIVRRVEAAMETRRGDSMVVNLDLYPDIGRSY